MQYSEQRLFEVKKCVKVMLKDCNGHSCLFRERSLSMGGVGTEEKALCSLKKALPHHLLKSNSLYPTVGKQ